MDTTARREPCKIYQFPLARRLQADSRREASAQPTSHTRPSVETGSAWYHQAAIREDRGERP